MPALVRVICGMILLTSVHCDTSDRIKRGILSHSNNEKVLQAIIEVAGESGYDHHDHHHTVDYNDHIATEVNNQLAGNVYHFQTAPVNLIHSKEQSRLDDWNNKWNNADDVEEFKEVSQ